MGEIIENCPFRDCQYCQKDQRKFDELVQELSLIHIKKTTDPEILFRSSKNHFFKGIYYDEIFQKQKELFSIASQYNLRWTKKFLTD